MKILVVCQHFWPENFHVNDLCAGLAERGHDVTVLTGKPNYPLGSFFEGYSMFGHGEDRYRGVRVVRVPLIPRGKGKKLELVANYFSFAAAAWLKAGALARREKFDLVLVYQLTPIFMAWPGIRAARAGRCPMAMMILDVWPDSLKAVGIGNPALLRWAGDRVRSVYRRCRSILISSQGFAERVRAMGYEGNIHFTPQWVIPTERDEDAAPRMPHAELNVLFAGNLGTAQGLEVVIETADMLRTEHPGIHFTLLGDGRYRSHLEKLVRERGLQEQIHFPGRCPGSQVPAWLDAADCALITLRRDELFARTLPAKMQGYLQHGIPILACMDGEGAQVVQDAEAGFSAPAGDAAALRDIVLRMAATPPEERAAMAERGRAFYHAHYDREMMLDRIEGILRELAQ